MARMTDFHGALEDVYTRDVQSSSVEIRKVGETKPTQHCSKCGKTGHRAPECGRSESNQKFVHLDSLDPVFNVRNKVLGHESDDEDYSEEIVMDENIEELMETPKRRKTQEMCELDEESHEVPRVKRKIDL